MLTIYTNNVTLFYCLGIDYCGPGHIKTIPDKQMVRKTA